MRSLVPCVYECVWWGSGGISNSQLFPRHGKEGGGLNHPGSSSEGCFLNGWAVLQPQPGSPGSPRVPQDGRTSPVPELQSTGPLWTAFSHTHPHSVTGSLALSYNFCTSGESQPRGASCVRPRPGDSWPHSGRGSLICTRRLDLVISQGLSAPTSWLSLLAYSGRGTGTAGFPGEAGKSLRHSDPGRHTHKQRG